MKRNPRKTQRTIPASLLTPAPYLAGASSLPPELAKNHLTSPAEQRRAGRMLRRIKRELFLLRSQYEIEEGVKVIPEPTPVI